MCKQIADLFHASVCIDLRTQDRLYGDGESPTPKASQLDIFALFICCSWRGLGKVSSEFWSSCDPLK